MSVRDDDLRAENQDLIDALRDQDFTRSAASGTASPGEVHEDVDQAEETNELGSHLGP